MPHITFIHGISNKPAPNELLHIWRETLAGAGLPLEDYGVSSSLVYWADVLYEKPDSDAAAHESLSEDHAGSLDASGAVALPSLESPEEAEFLERLRSHFTALSDAELETAEAETPAVPSELGLERVPLPWPLKKLFLRAFLRDAHHYLFDSEHSPRPGETYRVRQEIRHRFVTALQDSKISSPHIVVAHSLGSVIAYDCLKNVPGCPAVDGVITIGSPLGLDEVQDKLTPHWSREDGYPSSTNHGGWGNFCDPLDPACGFDAALANDFKRQGVEVIQDYSVENEGSWRHSAVKYLRREAVLAHLKNLLQL